MATLATLAVNLKLDAANYTKGVATVEKSTARLGKSLSSIGKKATQFVTLPILAAGVVIAKAASDWESAFTGVRKTVDTTEEGFAELEKQLLDLAKVVPISPEALASIAELGGQLGVPADQIAGFTETIAKLGVTTNLAGEEAASGIARFINITQGVAPVGADMVTQTQDIGSAIVDLGNNLATTESEILTFASRIAGAGAAVGLTQPEILAWGAALSSMGLNAEAGGTAISRVFLEMSSAVAEGGEKLDKFAAVAGVSAEEFAAAFEEDASNATMMFIEGLGRMQDAGENIIPVLDDLELGEIRVRDTLLRAASASDLLRDATNLANTAYAEGNALNKEAALRFATVESKLQLAKNAMNLMLITLGNFLLPILTELAQELQPVIERMTEWLAQNPRLAKFGLIIAGLAALIGPVLLILGALATAIGAIGAPVLIAIAAVGLLAAAWATNFGGIRDKTAAAWAAIQPIFAVLQAWLAENLPRAWEKLKEIAGKVAEFISDFVTGRFQIVADWVQENWPLIQQTIETVMTAIRTIVDSVVGWLSAFWTEHHEKIEAVAKRIWDFVVGMIDNNLKTILGIVKAVMQLINGDWETAWQTVKETASNFLTNILELVNNLLGDLVAAVINAAPGLLEAGKQMMSGLLQGILSKAAEIVAAAVGIIKDAIAAAWAAIRGASPSRVFMEIGGSIGDGLALGITRKIGRVVAAIRQMFKGLSDAARADLKDFIEVLSSLGAGISGALAGLSALRDYDPRGGLPKRLEKFASDMHKVIVFLRNVAKKFAGPGLESAKTFAEAAGAIGSSIVNAIAGLVALAGFEKVAGLRAKVEALANQLQTVVGHIRRVSRDFKTKGLESAKAFAEAVGPIVDMIAGAVQGIKDLLDYQSALNLPALAAALANDLWVVVDVFRIIGETFVTKGLEAATAFANAASAVVSVIGVALEAIPLLADYVRQEVVEAAAYLATDIADIVDQFSEASDLITTVAMDKASAFATGAATVFAFIKTSLDVIALLREYSSPAAEKTQKFLEDVERIVGLVAEAVAAMFAIDQGGRFAVLNLYLRGQMAVTLWLQGMIDGIHAKAPAVIAAIQTLINDLVDTAEKTLGIASPSEAFSDIGALTMQGLVDGILSRARDALQAMTDLIERISGVGVTDFYEAGKNSAWEWLRGWADAMRAAELVPVIPATIVGGVGGMTAAGGGTTAGGDTYNIFVTYRNEQDEASLRDTIRALQMAGA